MKNYKELKVYRIAEPAVLASYGDQLFICHGAACDEKYSCRCYKNMPIQEERILFRNEIPQDGSVLYRVYSDADKKATSWYPNDEDAWAAAKQMNLSYPDVSHAYLDATVIEPHGKEPFTVQFSLDEQGRPYTRINTHPEWDGRNAKGKIFFADRSLTGADIGFATVTIAREFDTYGFLAGKMDPYVMPDMGKVLDWAWENEHPSSHILFINHPGRGKYVAIKTPKDEIARITETHYDWSEQTIWKGALYDEVVVKDAEKYTERECSLTQLYLEDAWGKSVDLKNISNLFYDISDLVCRRDVAWTFSCKFFGKDIDTACKQGFLSQVRVEGRQIDAFDIHEENMLVLANFTYSEMQEVAAKVSKINHDAENTIRSLMKKGKL